MVIILFTLFVIIVVGVMGIEEDLDSCDKFERKTPNKRCGKNERD
ncbi:hypothetical protein [Jeotgalibaca porci]